RAVLGAAAAVRRAVGRARPPRVIVFSGWRRGVRNVCCLWVDLSSAPPWVWGVASMRAMRWGLIALAFFVFAAPARGAVIGNGDLLALGAQDGRAYAVLSRPSAAKPFLLVAGAKKTPFGIPGAEDPDVGGGIV